jgi:hypothetical protein
MMMRRRRRRRDEREEERMKMSRQETRKEVWAWAVLCTAKQEKRREASILRTT